MKNLIIVLPLLIATVNLSFSQENSDECRTKLSIFHEYVKSKNYDAAYDPGRDGKDNGPKLNIAIYNNRS